MKTPIGSPPGVSDSAGSGWSLRTLISNRSPGDADEVVQAPTLGTTAPCRWVGSSGSRGAGVGGWGPEGGSPPLGQPQQGASPLLPVSQQRSRYQGNNIN